MEERIKQPGARIALTILIIVTAFFFLSAEAVHAETTPLSKTSSKTETKLKVPTNKQMNRYNGKHWPSNKYNQVVVRKYYHGHKNYPATVGPQLKYCKKHGTLIQKGNRGSKVSTKKIKRGDIVFFYFKKNQKGGLGHTAICGTKTKMHHGGIGKAYVVDYIYTIEYWCNTAYKYSPKTPGGSYVVYRLK
ncbi:MAG: hypothetical protein ACOYJJ_00725 [Anaerovoracaceae bacterium]